MGATGGTRGVRGELAALVRLATPVAGVQVAMMAMGVVDTAMVGHVSEQALDAVALGNMYSWWVCGVGMGILGALDPLVAQAVGARDEPAIARALQRGLLIAFLLCLPSAPLLLLAGRAFRVLDQPSGVVPAASAFAAITLAGVPALYLFVTLRQTLQAMHRTRAVVVTAVVGNVANLALNWILVFGHLGFAPRGAIGSAWATVGARWIMASALAWIAWPDLRAHLRPWRSDALVPSALLRMLRLGAPIGAQFLLEMGTFSAVMLAMGWLGTRELAAHQIAINLASFSFMMPLGISMAAAILVGNAVGRGDPEGLRRSAGVSIAAGGGIMACWGAVFFAAPDLLAHAYTSDPSVAALAASLIRVAAVFQVFDGLQVVSIGVLRGTGDTLTPMVVNVVGFLCFGLPLSLWLGLRTPLGAVGMWWGLVAGLGLVAAILLARVRRRLRHAHARVTVDGASG